MSSARPGRALRFYDVTSADGTRLRAWTNDADGPTVLLCNGLGTNPYAWPALLDSDCGVRVVSWNHRGVGGSDRPDDPERVGVDAFVEDALAVLDDAGVHKVVVAGWSIGVNTAFELAVLAPERVSGLFAVAGVPGGTFSSMGAPLMLPRPVRRPVAVGVASAMQHLGKVVTPVTSRLPVGPLTAQVLTHSGFMLPVGAGGGDLADVQRAVREFLTTPIDWYMHLARAAAEHPRVSLRSIRVPTAFVAGHYDVLASAHDMRTAAERIPDASYEVLPGSHFLQLEHPQFVHEQLLALVARTGQEPGVA
ncbi:alpha/beta fold hydrolase [Nocardioides iriomotensis]|uniref:Alpha/beta hydrolase n=1 Tax=Nocardioides iriomotensis TaxID=715784 RepID=A0A4Q5J1K0_9ACTN|nr:alpha/beta hydrolase [Nocardioides iriomotensis]RYU12264.1 alpha/beta hydrolase [Nocardioides iriomotensis]